MTEQSDGVPEPIMVSERSKRTTTEFCNDQQDGYRCMLLKGHSGTHVCIGSGGVSRWPSSRLA